MVRKFSLLFAALGASFAASAVHAQTTFYASGTFADGAVLSGTLTINTTSGSITASDLVVSAPDANAFINIIGQSSQPPPLDYSVDDRNSASTEDFDFGLPVSSLVGYTGGAICSDATAPGCVPSNLFNLTTNTAGSILSEGALSLTPTGVPEPGTLALFATSGLGMVSLMARKRRRK